MEIREPWITVRLNGATLVELPTVNCNPVGALANDRLTVFGSSRTLVVACRPPLSVAVRRSMRKLGYSWSGAANEPLATPLKVWIGWTWQEFGSVGQWCMSRDQVRRAAPSVPSSASVAWPEKLIVSPTAQVRALVGLSMNAVGAVLLTEIEIVALFEAPPGSVTRSRAR